MNSNLLRTFILLLPLFGGMPLMGQSLERSVVASGGDFFSYGSGDISWTIGEMVMEKTALTGQHVTQGFQQPFRIIPAAAYLTNPNPDLRLYPNPFQEIITLEGAGLANQTHLEVWDASGKLVFTQEILLAAHRTMLY